MRKRDFNKIQDNLKQDFIMKNLIHNTENSKPYVDTAMAQVFWGTDATKEKKHAVSKA